MAGIEGVDEAAGGGGEAVAGELDGLGGGEGGFFLVKQGVGEFDFPGGCAVGVVEADEDVFALDGAAIDEGHSLDFQVTAEAEVFIVAREEDAFEDAAVWQEADG